MAGSLEGFIELHERLLNEEVNAERAEVEELLKTLPVEQLADAGIAVPRLVITDVSAGLYGRTIATFISKKKALNRLHGGGDPASQPQAQQQHRLSPGDTVGVFRYDRPISGSQSALASGVIHKIHAFGLSVAFDEKDWQKWLQQHDSSPDDSAKSFNVAYSVCLTCCETTINRLRSALRELRDQAFGAPASRLVSVCFGQARLRFLSLQRAASIISNRQHPPPPDEHGEPADGEGVCRDWQSVELSSEAIRGQCLGRPWFCEALTEAQRRAVYLSLLSQDVALIHGPPGTGKTTTVVEVLLQLLAAGCRVLACAPSNIAVDNMLERCIDVVKAKKDDPQLASRMKRCVRIGHPARVDERLSAFCLDRQHLNSDASGVVRDCKDSLDQRLRELSALKKRKNTGTRQPERGSTGNVRRELLAEVRELRKDIKSMQMGAVQETLKAAPIVFATCVGAGDAALQNLVKGQRTEKPGTAFDVVVIDEAAQALEASCWIPLLLGKRCVLAGDHMQLPPTVRSAEALRRGLGISLFERLMRRYERTAGEQLVCQFRMHKHIMEWSNDVFYRSSLVAAACVENSLLSALYPEAPQDFEVPVRWIDTAGISWCQEDEVEGRSCIPGLGRSRTNRAEAALVVKYIQELMRTCGIAAAHIGVITPYAAQARLIRRYLRDAQEDGEDEAEPLSNVAVQTVDGFQGKEREVIIISLVRSNPRKEIGFLADTRRLNVAVTRARKHLVIIGDSETVIEGLGNEATAKDRNASDNSGLPSASAEERDHQPECVETRKALKKLFHVASTRGDLRVPFEYLAACDVPAAEGGSLAARQAKTECSAQSGREKTEPPVRKGSSKPAKRESERRQTPGRKAAAGSNEAAAPPPGDSEGSGFLVYARKVLEELRSKADSAGSNGAGESTAGSFTFTFTSLTPYQRRIVHELAEELHLGHVSRGEGAQRVLEVRAGKQGAPRLACDKASTAAADEGPQPATSCWQAGTAACKRPELQEESEGLCMQPPTPQHSPRAEDVAFKGKPAADKPRRRKPSTGRVKAEAAKECESEDLDSLLEQFVQESKRCGVAKCKESMQLLGRTCPFCMTAFCFTHAMPEVHGCGEAAAVHAKRAFQKQAKSDISSLGLGQNGSTGRRTAGSNPQQREQLAANCRKSIQQKAKARAPRGPGKN
ncbi:hypothetical protein Efla_001434 [Eimeria flavescens]